MNHKCSAHLQCKRYTYNYINYIFNHFYKSFHKSLLDFFYKKYFYKFNFSRIFFYKFFLPQQKSKISLKN